MADEYGYTPSFTVVVDQDGKALEMPQEEAQAGLQSGSYKVPLNDPEGNPVTANSQEAAALLSKGYKNPSNEQYQSLLDYTKYSAPGEQLKTGIEGAASAIAPGISTVIAEQLGIPAEEQLARRETNPIANISGQIAGLAAGTLAGVGAPGLIAKVAAPGVRAATALGRIGSAATQAAIENAIFQSGDEITKKFLNDPDQSVETALTDIGFAAALGGGLGAAFKGGGELWDITAGKSINTFLDKVSAANTGKSAIEDELGIAMSPEARAYTSGNKTAENIGGNLIESESKSGMALREEVDSIRQGLKTSTLETLGRTEDDLANLADVSKAETGVEFKKQLESVVKQKIEPIEAAYNKFDNQFKKAAIDATERDATANSINQLIVDNGLLKGPNESALKLAQKVLTQLDNQATAADLRAYAQGLRDVAPYGSENYQIGKQLRSAIEDLQEKTVEKAASGTSLFSQFKATQAEYRNFKNLLGELNDRLHLGREAKSGKTGFLNALKDMEPEKIASRLKLREDTQLQQLLAKEFPELNQIVQKQEMNNLIRSSLTAERDAVDIKKLAKELFKLQPELRGQLLNEQQLAKLKSLEDIQAKLPKRKNPSGTAGVLKSMQNSGNAISIATGIISGNILAGIGAHIMQKAVGKAHEGANLAMLRFLGTDAKISARGFAGLAELAQKFINGEKKLTKATKGVFGASDAIPKASEVNTAKVRKAVNELSMSPEKMLDMQNDSAYYAPEHGASIAKTLSRNVAYLNTLRPKTPQLAPLSNKLVASKEEEQRYENALIIAEQPLTALNGVKSGRVTMETLADLQAMHPALMANMQEKLMNEMTAMVAKGQQIPYQTKIGLSIFMGQPLDASLRQQNIQAAQPMSMGQTFQAPPSAGQKTRVSGKLEKVPQSNATPEQAREANKHK